MSFINFYVLIPNVSVHIDNNIIEEFTYFLFICDDIIIFLKYYIFLVGASFVGKEMLHSEAEIFSFWTLSASFNKIIIYRLLLQFCYIIPLFTISLHIFSRVYILEFVKVHSLFIYCRSQSFIHIWNLLGFNFPFCELLFPTKCC